MTIQIVKIEEKLSGIYLLTNEITGKSYIGQSINVRSRLYTHRCGARKGRNDCPLLYHAIRKYGWDNFSCTILEAVDPALLDQREAYWVSLYNVVEDGYNMDQGGLHRQHSPERRDRIRKSRVGYKHSEETRKLISENSAIKGKQQSPEHLAKRTENRRQTMKLKGPQPSKIKGKIAYNDGTRTKYFTPGDDVPPEFKFGSMQQYKRQDNGS